MILSPTSEVTCLHEIIEKLPSGLYIAGDAA
jgi:hypothetical protein